VSCDKDPKTTLVVWKVSGVAPHPGDSARELIQASQGAESLVRQIFKK